ncbi:MAG: chorismate mutase [Rhodobiaceae bacterium]|nr:chorismate mutase [Rhodobiaceae bacterium]MCC0012356.1 chorismate mutase [Rhodobiaceae bacterium]MCC0019078.1 chorismate mutase [Rhodobiaceae bacterium]MCC0051926.1 chorismate mutase [Rhodobiaceae bacterium]
MPPTQPDDADTLAALRTEIDEIDAQMHALLQRRATVIEALVKAKKTRSGAAFRPDREAHMMQRLAARHKGELPFLTIAHIWRVIISTFTQLQASYRVYLGGEDPALRDLARYQFGFSTPLVPCPDRESALMTLSDTSSDLSLVFNGGDADWWTAALDRGGHVIAVLPELSGRDGDVFHPALVFAANSVSVDALPLVILALSSENAGPLARLIETEGCTALIGPVEQGTRALVSIDRDRAEQFNASAHALGVAFRAAGGAAAPVGPKA